MTEFRRAGLAAKWFGGFERVWELRASARTGPNVPGVYVVLAPAAVPGTFLAASSGGRFKGKDPMRGLTLPYPASNARAKSSEGPAWPADSSAVWVRAKPR